MGGFGVYLLFVRNNGQHKIQYTPKPKTEGDIWKAKSNFLL